MGTIGSGCADRGEIDSLAPNVVGESVASNDPRDDRAGADANPDLDVSVMLLVKSLNLFPQADGQFGHGFGMVWRWDGDAADNHVRVANGFDFFQPVISDQNIKGGKDIVQYLDDLAGINMRGEGSEANEIGDEHAPAAVVAEKVGNASE